MQALHQSTFPRVYEVEFVTVVSEPTLRAYVVKRPSGDYSSRYSIQMASSSTQSGDLTKSMQEMNISKGLKIPFGSFTVVM